MRVVQYVDMSGLVCVYDIPVNTTVVLPDVLFRIDSHLIVLSWSMHIRQHTFFAGDMDHKHKLNVLVC